MLLLDYLRKLRTSKDSKDSQGSKVKIPPFHTGHLGLVPGTEVSVRLMGDLQERRSDCELSLTPFAEDYERLFSLHCVLTDKPGVVHKLIGAIYSLRINIVTLGTSVTDYKTTHTVDMMLDWHRSKYPDRIESPARIKSIYQETNCRIPVSDFRYVLLYETIMALCGKEVVLDKAYGRLLPSVTLQPFAPRRSVDATPTAIMRDDRLSEVPTATKVSPRVGQNHFVVHKGHEQQIRHATGYNEGEPMTYILNSSPTERCLRVYFPEKSTAEKFIHVGFQHTNRVGALWAITLVLEKAGFNIITGLLRKKDPLNSSFETVLEYNPTQKTAPKELRGGSNTPYDRVLKWCAERIHGVSHGDQRRLQPYNIQLRPPEYGPQKTGGDIRIPSPSVLNTKKKSGGNGKKDNKSKIGDHEFQHRGKSVIQPLKGAVDQLEENRSLDADERERLRFLRMTLKRLEQTRPRVFLSYPSYASAHAKAIKRALDFSTISQEAGRDAHGLQGSVDISEYQEADFKNIVESVSNRIRECDYFIGIWHHENTGTVAIDASSGTVSPWMPFEYGMAMEAGKDCRIIYSDRLPESTWKRIDSSTSKDAYNDFIFTNETVPRLDEWVRSNWVPSWVWLKPPEFES